MSITNSVRLIGNLGTDIELRYDTGGKAVANARLATNEHWTDAATGEPRTRTEWHNLVFWGQLAEDAAKYKGVGGYLVIEGRLRTVEYPHATFRHPDGKPYMVRKAEIHVGAMEFGPKVERSARVEAPTPAPVFQPTPREPANNPALDALLNMLAERVAANQALAAQAPATEPAGKAGNRRSAGRRTTSEEDLSPL